MRSREEVEAEVKFFDEPDDILPKRLLEVLLDIRDELIKVRETVDDIDRHNAGLREM